MPSNIGVAVVVVPFRINHIWCRAQPASCSIGTVDSTKW